MKESSLTVTFGKDVVDPAYYINIELDNDANEGKTVFDVGDRVFFKVYYDKSYEYDSSGGTLTKTATNIPMEIEDEYVVFAAVDSAYFAYTPSGSVTYSWVGNSVGNPSFSGRKITLSESSIAVLKCDYTTYGDQLSLTFSEEGEVVIVVVDEIGNKASITANFVVEEAEPVPYRIKVTDYCSNDDLSSVSVVITTDGAPLDGEVLVGGATDGNGEVYLGMLVPGRRYDLSMSKSGYLSSGSDVLNNDFFIVPE